MSHSTLGYQAGSDRAKQRWRSAWRRVPFAPVPLISVGVVGLGHLQPIHLKASWYAAIGFIGVVACVSLALGKVKFSAFCLAWLLLLSVFAPSFRAT